MKEMSVIDIEHLCLLHDRETIQDFKSSERRIHCTYEVLLPNEFKISRIKPLDPVSKTEARGAYKTISWECSKPKLTVGNWTGRTY